VVAVHPLGDDAPLGPQLAASPAALGKAFGLHTASVDGNSASAVHKAVLAARDQTGPTLIEATLTPGKDITASAPPAPPP
jgi:TPP-dependent pyruvate/acetoin dehydrogenase alpha subunit